MHGVGPLGFEGPVQGHSSNPQGRDCILYVLFGVGKTSPWKIRYADGIKLDVEDRRIHTRIVWCLVVMLL